MNLLTSAHLSHLEESGLIRLAQLEPEIEYLFRHGLVQDAVYESLLKQDRRKLHRAVGEALEVTYPDRLDALAGMLATHFAEAGEHKQALMYFQRAGDHAYAQYALTEAIGFYGAALEIGMKLDTPPIDALKNMALRKGRAYELIADYENALTTYERMEELATSAGDQAVRLAALVAQAVIRSTPSTVFDAEKGIVIAEQGMEIAKAAGDQATEARLLWTLSLAFGFGRSDMNPALDYGHRSAALCRELGLNEQLAYTLTDLSNMYLTAGRMQEASAMLDEAIPLWRLVNNPPMLGFSLNLVGQLEGMQNGLGHAEEIGLEALEILKGIRNLEGASFSYGLVAGAVAYKGEIDRALAYIRELMTMIEQAEFVIPMVGMTQVLLAALYVELGAYQRVKDEIKTLIQEYRFEEMARAMQAQALIELARLELAIKEPGVGVTMLTQLITQEYNFEESGVDILMWSGMVQAEYDYAHGKREAALEMLDKTLAVFEQLGVWREAPDALLLKSRILSELGREPEALEALEKALPIARRVANRLIEWRILATLAEMEAKHGRAEASTQHRREGRAILEQIAATLGDEPDLRASLMARPEAQFLLRE